MSNAYSGNITIKTRWSCYLSRWRQKIQKPVSASCALQAQSDGAEPWHQRGGGPERIKKADGLDPAE